MNYYEFLWHFEKLDFTPYLYFFDLAYLGFDLSTVGRTDDTYCVWLYSRRTYDSFDNAVELAQMMLEEGWLHK